MRRAFLEDIAIFSGATLITRDLGRRLKDVTLADLGLTASDPRDSLERARRSIEQALSLGRRHAQHDLRRAAAGEGAHEAHDECAPERRTFAISH